MKKINLTMLLFALIFGLIIGINIKENSHRAIADDLNLDEQEATIRAIKAVDPAVVSINVYDILNVLNEEDGELVMLKEKQNVGNGTGFIISSDGYIITNKHVVDIASSDMGEFKVKLNTGREYYAQLIDKDPLKDIAVLKIFDKDLPYVKIGNSSELEIGSTVIAIGNSRGIYQNSATKGIVSGLGRFILASDNANKQEALDNVIQTDAEINLGNSGGPLVNLKGEVIGVNVAVDQHGTAIGFAIPIADVEPAIRSIIKSGVIKRAKLGVYYLTLTPYMAETNELPRSSGAWINSNVDDIESVVADSPADKGGIEAGDIIFEINGMVVDEKNTLSAIIQKYNPGDKIGLKIQRGDKVLIKEVELGGF